MLALGKRLAPVVGALLATALCLLAIHSP